MLTVTTALASLGAAYPTLASIPTDGSMNILLIVADDVGVDNISGYQEQPNHSADTPNIDTLAGNGMLFRNAWASPKCSPSRASLFTGKHAFDHGVLNAAGAHMDASEQTIAELLSAKGYATALFGKWHLGQDPGQSPEEQGWDWFSGSKANVSDYFAWTKTQKNKDGSINQDVQETGYATEVNVQEALAWIAQNDGVQPWFATITFNAGHAPFQIPPKNMFSFRLKGKPGRSCNANARTPDPIDCYKAMVEAMDYQINELFTGMQAINGGNAYTNTLIIFVGDNGTPGSVSIAEVGTGFGPGRAKGTIYEGGINVPMIITTGNPSAQVAAGEVSDLAQMQDLFATIAELADTSAAAPIAGRSLLEYVDKNRTASNPRADVYTEHFQLGSGIDDWTMRNDRYKYMYQSGTEHCYDLVSDATESQNEMGNTGTAAYAACVDLRDNHRPCAASGSCP